MGFSGEPDEETKGLCDCDGIRSAKTVLLIQKRSYAGQVVYNPSRPDPSS
jgi:hypothetical protein